jgi:hypothetical protein
MNPPTFFSGFTKLWFAIVLVNLCFGTTAWSKQGKEMDEGMEPAIAAEPVLRDQPAQDQEQDPSEAEAAEPAPSLEPVEVIDPHYIRFHLWEGLIVGGEATIDAVDVETEFGALKIPISKIMRFYPGLDSMPGLQAKINELVQGLGDRNFDVRERSHNELLKYGNLLRNEIGRFDDGGSAERKKHLSDLRKKIEELEEGEEDQEVPRPLIRGDYIQTPSFSVVGKIIQSEFRLKSQFGEMVIPIGEIKMGDRTFGLVSPEVRKTIEIEAATFFPEGMNTKIKVNRGDKVSITASGDMAWTNWNTSCGPEGMSDKGQFRGFKSGMLLAQIGNKGDYFPIGSNGSFIAKSSGELSLGIAMADNFRSGGYNWTGKYNAKVLVKPAQTPR